jgi:hypothetical protein
VLIAKQNIQETIMTEYLQVQIGENSLIKIRVDNTDLTIRENTSGSGFEDVGTGKIQETLRKTAETVTTVSSDVFNETMSTVQALAYGFQRKLDDMKDQTSLDEASVEFGLAIDGKGNVGVAELGGLAHFKISLKWKVTSHSQKEG